MRRADEIEIPRWLGISPDRVYELHGFADASKSGYGCVIYVRPTCGSSAPILLLAKSRVAPISPAHSIPRLELKGALLLSEMIRKIQAALEIPMKVYGWLDSKVALSWITDANPNKWEVFVLNRVNSISENCPSVTWEYVRTTENPADLVSRGCYMDALSSSQLWNQGPAWLQSFDGQVITSKEVVTDEDATAIMSEQVRKTVCNVSETSECWLGGLIDRFSSYDQLTRVLALVIRFGKKVRKSPAPASTWPKLDEIREAEFKILFFSQRACYGVEISSLRSGKGVPPSSNLFTLDPVLDDQ